MTEGTKTFRTSVLLSAVVGALVVLSACADTSITSSTGDPATDGVDATTASTTDSSSTPDATQTTIAGSDGSAPVGSDQIDAGLQPYIDIAVADLATRLSIEASDVGVTSATLEVWSDASMGCPQPDQQYAQVETDGSLIVLTANGKTYQYHAGDARTPFLCELTSKATPITGLSTP